MKTIRLWLLAAAPVLVLPLQAVADVREAARSALRATVAVEFEIRESPRAPLPYGAPPATSGRAPEEYRGPLAPIPAPASASSGWPTAVPAPASATSGWPAAEAVPEAYRNWLQQVVAADSSLMTPQRTPELTMAAGTVVSPDGLIVTFGLPSGEGKLRVTFSDGTQREAQLAGKDLRTGLHLLKVEAAELPAVSLAEQPAELGETVIAVYCVSERARAIAHGIVAATGRMLSGFSVGLFQTDAAVGRMSAGGPLVDESGALVGILAAVQTHEAQTQGVTLAIPAEHVRSLLEARREGEVVVIQRPLLGIQPVEQPDQRSVAIAQVFDKSPAEAAGLRKGDEVIALDRERVHSPEDVVRIVGTRMPGDQIEVTIRRDGQEQVLTITLGEVPAPGTARRETLPRVSASTPTRILVYGPDGTLQSFTLPASPPPGPPLVAPTLRVERSGVEKKLDELSRDMRELKRQMEDLSRQLQRLADRPESGD